MYLCGIVQKYTPCIYSGQHNIVVPSPTSLANPLIIIESATTQWSGRLSLLYIIYPIYCIGGRVLLYIIYCIYCISGIALLLIIQMYNYTSINVLNIFTKKKVY